MGKLKNTLKHLKETKSCCMGKFSQIQGREKKYVGPGLSAIEFVA